MPSMFKHLNTHMGDFCSGAATVYNMNDVINITRKNKSQIGSYTFNSRCIQAYSCPHKSFQRVAPLFEVASALFRLF